VERGGRAIARRVVDPKGTCAQATPGLASERDPKSDLNLYRLVRHAAVAHAALDAQSSWPISDVKAGSERPECESVVANRSSRIKVGLICLRAAAAMCGR
jgi:hypothetical protein